MAFLGKDPVRSKICINNKTLEQVITFNYLGCALSYEGEKDVPSKISKFVKTTGVINQVSKPSLVQHTRLNIYSTLARPVLIYGSEAWTIRKADEKRLQAAEMKFMRKTAGFTLWDHKRNEEIFKKNWNSNQFLNLFRIIGPTGRNILKEWILAESQTTF
jgi:hypothetical protein